MASSKRYRYYVNMVDGFFDIAESWFDSEDPIPDLSISIGGNKIHYTYSETNSAWLGGKDDYAFQVNLESNPKIAYFANADATSPATIILNYIKKAEE